MGRKTPFTTVAEKIFLFLLNGFGAIRGPRAGFDCGGAGDSGGVTHTDCTFNNNPGFEDFVFRLQVRPAPPKAPGLEDGSAGLEELRAEWRVVKQTLARVTMRVPGARQAYLEVMSEIASQCTCDEWRRLMP